MAVVEVLVYYCIFWVCAVWCFHTHRRNKRQLRAVSLVAAFLAVDTAENISLIFPHEYYVFATTQICRYYEYLIYYANINTRRIGVVYIIYKYICQFLIERGEKS